MQIQSTEDGSLTPVMGQGGVEPGDRWIPGVHWPVTLTNQRTPGLVRDPVSKTQVDGG